MNGFVTWIPTQPFMNIVNKTRKFNTWLADLKNLRARAKILARIRRAEHGNFGDAVPVGDGVGELRVDDGPGYRIYFARQDDITYLLLCGGDKSSQQRDINVATALWKHIRSNLPAQAQRSQHDQRKIQP